MTHKSTVVVISYCSLLLLLLVLLLVQVGVSAQKFSDNEDVVFTNELVPVTNRNNQSTGEFYSLNYKHVQSAWFSAQTLPGRDPQFVRVDPYGNVILGRSFSKRSHLSWIAVLDGKTGNAVAVQQEYYGRGNRDNHAGALKLKTTDPDQLKSFLDLLEIGIRGHLRDEDSRPACWTPSEVHQSLMKFDNSALQWHRGLFEKDKTLGMHGHNTIFQPMEVYMKRFTGDDRYLALSDPLRTLMVVYDDKPQCSAVIGTFAAPEDQVKVLEDVKRNWGLIRVELFTSNRLPASALIPVTAANYKPNSYAAKLISKLASQPAKSTTIDTFSHDQFPALGSTSKTNKKT